MRDWLPTRRGLLLVLLLAALFPIAARADAPVTVTITQPAPIETVSPTGDILGVKAAVVGTKMSLLHADDTQLTLQDASGTRYLIDLSATDYTPPANATAANPPAAPTPAPPIPATNPTTASTPSIPTPPSAPAPPAVATPATTAPPLNFDTEIPPRDNFSKAAFRYWSPAYDQPIRGVIVLVPGFNGDGRGMVAQAPWQDLARQYRLALVACFLQGKDYHDATRGTGEALLAALKNFAAQASHPEIAQAPLLLYGESAGGQFNYNFALWKPELVMTFVVNKGGYYDQMEPSARTRATPGLFFLGQSDTPLRINAITGIWTAGRKEGALWALAPQPNSGHEFSKTAAVARVFFNAILKARLPADGPTAADASQMNPMPENQGWAGNLTTHEIHDASTDPQPDPTAAWLPDQASAEAWKTFVSGQG